VTDIPTIWAHVADQSDLDGMVEVVDRLHLEHVPCDLAITGPLDVSHPDFDVEPLRDFDPQARDIQTLIWMDNAVNTRVLGQSHRSGMPVILANISTNVLEGQPTVWQKPLAQSTLKTAKFALVQSQQDRDYLLSLGVDRRAVQVTGVLQGCGLPPSYDASERQEIVKALTGCQIWFARGVPMAELDLVLDAYDKARRNVRKLVLFLDPMDEADAPTMTAAARARGFSVAERAVEAIPDASTHVFVTDGAFERGLWYSLAVATYLGGTFRGDTCANPLVSAAVGSALITGPNSPKHHAALARMQAAEAVTIAATEDELGVEVARCVRPETAALYAQAGWTMVANAAEGINRTVDLIKDILQPDQP